MSDMCKRFLSLSKTEVLTSNLILRRLDVARTMATGALLGYRDLRQLVDINPVGDDVCSREIYLQVGGR